MAQLKVPEAPKEYATHYEMLLGVDYQADQTQVDKRRSPDMVNMISDAGGNPVKRDGYRKVGHSYASLIMINGVIYGAHITSSILIISELELDGYKFTEKNRYTLDKNVGEVNAAFAYQERIYLIATKCLISFDTVDHTFKYVGIGANMMSVGTVGESNPVMTDNIPLTVYKLKPNGSGGKAYDDKNVFSIYQRYEYEGDGTATEYTLPNYKKIGNWVKAEVKDEYGDWQEVTVTLGAATSVTGKTIDGASTASTSVVDAKVTFSTAPSAPAVTGEDNVRITFAPFSMDEISSGVYKGFYNETAVNLLNSDVATFQSGRLFIAETYKVYYSDVSDPFTVSDLAWFDVDAEVVCFTRSNSHLAIVTKDNGRNTIFLADEATRTVDKDTGETETYFTIKASNAGIGAVAPKCVSTLSDEPLFLSDTGVFGILSNYLSEKYVVNRSSRINRRLCKEANLETAVGIAYKDYFYVAINSRMYVLDGRHKESDRAGNKPFEAFFFEGLPVVKNMYVVGDRMYFADDEYTYTWSDDLSGEEQYFDNASLATVTDVIYQIGSSDTEPPTGEWQTERPTSLFKYINFKGFMFKTWRDDEYLWYRAIYDNGLVETTMEERAVGDTKFLGEPVCAKWCSVFDDDGAPQKLKTLMKKGSMVTIVPHYKSGCEVTLVKDGDISEYLGIFDSTLASFGYIDFTKFVFKPNSVAFDKFTRKKIKKYKRLQIIVENNKAEPFGLTQITKTYTFGNYAKR